jgi:2-polyprenyl-6-methoxyphenol hydroxylase-like FAD-dependent oxidoreductase
VCENESPACVGLSWVDAVTSGTFSGPLCAQHGCRSPHGATVHGKIETIFGDSITTIEESPSSVHVTFNNGPARDFDLVIGADGLHSRVRELAFGPESQFENYLGYKVAAFETPGYRPRDEQTYVMYTEVGQQVSRFTMREDRTMFLFIFKDESLDPGNASLPAQKALLRQRFGNSEWECEQILNALDAIQDLYFDRVSQIRMDARQGRWTGSS